MIKERTKLSPCGTPIQSISVQYVTSVGMGPLYQNKCIKSVEDRAQQAARATAQLLKANKRVWTREGPSEE